MDFSISTKMQTILKMMDEFVVKELIPLEKDLLADNLDTVYAAIDKKRALIRQMELEYKAEQQARAGR